LLTLGGNVSNTLNSSRTLNIIGAGNTLMSGTLAETGTSGTKLFVVKLGAGTLTLSGASTYTGSTTISAGTLSVGTLANGGTASNIGQSTNAAGNLVFDGGTLQYTGATIATDRAFTINAGKTATIDTANGLTLAGATGTPTNGALTKIGNGTLALTGASTYTGATTVTAGTLLVNGSLGSTAVAVLGGTFGGTGTIAGSVVVGAGTYSPGASPGSLEIGGDLTLGTASTTGIELGGTAFTLNGTEEYDRTKLTGSTPTLTLAGALAVNLFGGFTLSDNQAFGIFQLGSGATRLGTFAGMEEHALVGTFGGKDLYITYQGDFGDTGPVATFGGNDIVLYSIPEPRAASLGALGILMLLRRRKR
jgi:autotransporter-associated beta strand protein